LNDVNECGRSSDSGFTSTPSRFTKTVAKIEASLKPFGQVAEALYSYGDSAGITPASLLIPLQY